MFSNFGGRHLWIRHWSGTHAWTWHEVLRPGWLWGHPSRLWIAIGPCMYMNYMCIIYIYDRYLRLLFFFFWHNHAQHVFGLAFLRFQRLAIRSYSIRSGSVIAIIPCWSTLKTAMKSPDPRRDFNHSLVVICHRVSHPYLNQSMCIQTTGMDWIDRIFD